MNSEAIHILLVDDDEDDYILTRDSLEAIEQFKYRLDWVMNYDKALKKIVEQTYDIYLVDYRLGKNDGISLMKEALAHDVKAPVIILTGKGDKNIDLLAMREGAADYLVKSEMTPQILERSIRYALKNAKAIKQIRESEAKFRQLFERSIDAIYVSDLNHQIEDVNPSLSALLEYKYEEIVRANMECLFEEKEEFARFKKLLEKKNYAIGFETNLKSKNGGILVCQLASVLRSDEDGNSIGYYGIIHDVTMRKKTEHELIIAERLAMTGKISRSIAHEVRNPLTNLGLSLEQLEDELSGENESVRLYIDIIKRNANRINQLITEMLNSSKPKQLDKVEYFINDLLNEALELVEDRLLLKGMKIVKSYTAEPHPVLVDVDNLKTAIVNILVNAIEAMEENEGILTIETARTSDRVIIHIKDNGTGISKEDMKKLFDPFHTRKHGGMGLGLTSAQNIVHSHGGSIEVQSQIGEGTSFYISLPD